jgi:D-alanine-D-alanine ligase
MRAPRLIVLCGGASDEHDVSLASARSVMAAIDGRLAFEAVVLDRGGHVMPPEEAARALGRPPTAAPLAANGALAHASAPRTLGASPDGRGRSVDVGAWGLHAGDVVFPLLHGPYGEDGSVQGLLKVMGLPHVGSGVLASAVGMDKLTMKAVFAAHGLPQVAYRPIAAHAWRRDPDAVAASLAGLAWPRFVKPANLGSSIGIARADDEASFRLAVDDALRYDRRVIVEEAVVGVRELEVAVLGNDAPELSPIGEIRYDGAFYDYGSKYTAGRADLRIPAEVPDDVAARVREVALRAFLVIDAAGLARVDLFYDERSGEVYLNEINTMPGFTTTSMYPKLWEAAGLRYGDLIERLVELALERR